VSRRNLAAGLLGLAIGWGLCGPAALAAEGTRHGPAGHGSGGAANEAYLGATDRMHREMAIEPSGDVDLDFVRSMIPHHQGAIDMARALLAASEDPELRKLAEEIIAAQEKEIAFLRSWLQKKGEKSG
jgi:uncharacterized protein (DUF305 family)